MRKSSKTVGNIVKELGRWPHVGEEVLREIWPQRMNSTTVCKKLQVCAKPGGMGCTCQCWVKRRKLSASSFFWVRPNGQRACSITVLGSELEAIKFKPRRRDNLSCLDNIGGEVPVKMLVYLPGQERPHELYQRYCRIRSAALFAG